MESWSATLAPAALLLASLSLLVHIHVDTVVIVVYVLGLVHGSCCAKLASHYGRRGSTISSQPSQPGTATLEACTSPRTILKELKDIDAMLESKPAAALSTVTEYTVEEYEDIKRGMKSSAAGKSKTPKRTPPPPSAHLSGRASRSGRKPQRYGWE